MAFLVSALRSLPLAVTAAVLLLAACGDTGPDAGPPGATETVCTGNFCIGYPGDWLVAEVGDDFVRFEHPTDPEILMASVGQVNMEGVVTNAGNSWPQLTDGVVRSFWALLGETGAELSTLEPRRDGSVASLGSFEDGRLWLLVAPTDTRNAIGVEVRAPNSTWSTHVDVFFDTLEVVG